MNKGEKNQVISLLIDALMNKEDIIIEGAFEPGPYIKYHYSKESDGERYLSWNTNDIDSDIPRWYGVTRIGDVPFFVMNWINGNKKNNIIKPETILRRSDILTHKRLTKKGIMKYAILLRKAIDENRDITLRERHITGNYHMIYYEYDPLRLEYRVHKVKETYFNTPRQVFPIMYLKKEIGFSDITYKVLQEQSYVIEDPAIDSTPINIKFILNVLKTMKNDIPQIFY